MAKTNWAYCDRHRPPRTLTLSLEADAALSDLSERAGLTRSRYVDMMIRKAATDAGIDVSSLRKTAQRRWKVTADRLRRDRT